MPELAEVEYFRRQWDSGFGARVIGVAAHPEKRVFRGTDVAALEKALTGARLLGSEGHGKQMLFRFSRSASLGKGAPEWWRNLPPAVTSPAFTRAVLGERLRRGRLSPVKAALLDQTLFPGVGNWMADEIIWQIRVHPATHAGDLSASQQHDLWRTSRAICRTALRTIGVDWSEPPKNWLIHRRWQKGGRCPRDGTLLDHGTIAGRTTAWCPVCQKPSSQPARNPDIPR